MSFDFSSLITDRTQADVSRVEQISAKIKAGTASESEMAEFNSAAMKGAYNYTDLNRVTAAMDALKAKLEGYGYIVPGYQRIKIEHNPPPVPVVPGESRLPDGYLELTYIESTGTQYIDTGFKHNQDTRVVMDVQATSLTANAWAFEGRSTTTTAKHGIFFFYSDTKQWTTDYSNTGRKAFDEIGSMDRLKIDYNKNVCTINGQTITHTANTFQSECNLALLADSRSTGFSGFLKAKLYSCQVYDNGTLIRDFVPCIDPSGNIGLFDVVNLQFYGNPGAGVFVAGEVAEHTSKISDGVNTDSNKVSMKNLVSDASFETTNTWSTWSTDAIVTDNSLFGTRCLKLTGDQLASVPVETPIIGHKYYAREYIKTDGEVTVGDGRFEVHGGDGVGLNWVYGWNRGNYPGWTMQSAIHKIEAVNASSYVMRTFKVGGSGTAYIDGVMLIDLTAAFGDGYEPDQEWCDKYIPFFDGTKTIDLPPRYEWKEYDVPNTEQMSVYLMNVAAIRSILAVMASTPSIPPDMEHLMVQEANDIEQIVLDVYRQLTIMPTTFIPCGEALCGGDNL